jgi:hypothetical protein
MAAMRLYLWLACLLTIITHTSAQADVGCEGIVSTYNETGLVVPFHNLCGKDIGALVDFLDPTDEVSWADCLGRCVDKSPLCYGFDFRPLGSVDKNCWLMNASFDAESAVYPGYPVDAAMLAPALVDWLSSDCRTLGLRGCFDKNGRLDEETGSVTGLVASILSVSATPSSTTASSTTSPSSTSTLAGTPATTSAPSTGSEGLSKGARSGIIAGIVCLTALVVLFVAFVCLRRRKQRGRVAPNVGEAEVSAHHLQAVELLGHKGSYSVAELPSPRIIHELGSSEPEKVPVPIGELMGSSPERR